MDQERDGQFVEALTDREQEILRLMADGLTDRDISQELFLALATVKWYNRRVYEKLAVRNRTEAVARAREGGVLTLSAPASSPASVARSTLPVGLTSFIGREREIEEITHLLTSARLVTLVGPPGTGKTRLTLEIARMVAEDGSAGDVFYVPLAPLSHPSEVLEAIAETLDAHQAHDHALLDTVGEALHGRRVLLVLDNFEHLLPAASVTHDLLRQNPDLTILVTSREVLRVYGEHVYLVPPLPLPDARQIDDVAQIAEYEAIRLFTDRARAAASHFRATDANLRAIAEICTRLDGLPLAIELAAARMRLFTPEALLARLDDRFEAVRGQVVDLPPRHETLRRTIDWSYDLLKPEEATLLARLSAFRGGHTLEAAVEVCGIDPAADVIGGIESLLDKSLLVFNESPNAEPRFSMLETVFAYSREKLEAAGELPLLRARHADYFVALAEAAYPATRGGPHQRAALQRLQAEQDNLLTVLRWSFGDGEPEYGLRLVGALAFYWFRQAHPAMWMHWGEKALELSEEADPLLRAGVCFANGHLTVMSHDIERSISLTQEAVRLYRSRDAPGDLGWGLLHLLQCLDHAEKLEGTFSLAEEALDLFEQVDDRIGQAHTYTILGELFRTAREYDQATDAYQQALALARQNNDEIGQCIALANMAATATAQGRGAEALVFARDATRIELTFNNPHFDVTALVDISGPLVMLGDADRATRLLGAVEALLESLRVTLQPSDELLRQRYSELARDALSEADFEAAYAAGKLLTREEALALALDDSDI